MNIGCQLGRLGRLSANLVSRVQVQTAFQLVILMFAISLSLSFIAYGLSGSVQERHSRFYSMCVLCRVNLDQRLLMASRTLALGDLVFVPSLSALKVVFFTQSLGVITQSEQFPSVQTTTPRLAVLSDTNNHQ